MRRLWWCVVVGVGVARPPCTCAGQYRYAEPVRVCLDCAKGPLGPERFKTLSAARPSVTDEARKRMAEQEEKAAAERCVD